MLSMHLVEMSHTFVSGMFQELCFKSYVSRAMCQLPDWDDQLSGELLVKWKRISAS